MLYITGDTHGEENRFLYLDSEIERNLTAEDVLFIAGDWGYISDDSYPERQFLRFLSEKLYKIMFVDGNHENFDLLEEYPVEEYCGGKVHVIRRDRETKEPKVIHLMRGQVYEIQGKKIFTFGGGYSKDRVFRTPGRSWWPQEMPTEEEYKEGLENLTKHNNQVDYIITHTVPEESIGMYARAPLPEESPLNSYLEYIRENVEYGRWFHGHMHTDREIWRNQVGLYFAVRNMETNEVLE